MGSSKHKRKCGCTGFRMMAHTHRGWKDGWLCDLTLHDELMLLMKPIKNNCVAWHIRPRIISWNRCKLSHLRNFYLSYLDHTWKHTYHSTVATSAFRFGHSLVRAHLLRLDNNFRSTNIGPLPLSRTFFNPLSYFESGHTDMLLRGLTVD